LSYVWKLNSIELINEPGLLVNFNSTKERQGCSANFYTFVSDIFHKNATASMTEISGFAGSKGGALSASSFGLLLENTESYFLIFMVQHLFIW